MDGERDAFAKDSDLERGLREDGRNDVRLSNEGKTEAASTTLGTSTPTSSASASCSDPDDGANRRTQRTTQKKRTPLPWFQLFIVCLIQFAEPITGTVIYPFVNQFVRETGVTEGDERRTGYFAGIIESMFFLGECVTVFYWGWASDRIGRRPILLLGPLGLSLAMLGFGLSKRFWSLVVFRAFQGAFNGNIGVSKTVMAEITDTTNIADAFALMPMIWSIGTTLSPIIGGILARPAITWPEIFGKFEFFHEYPYFLPCAVSSFIAFLSAVIAFFGLKETLASAIHRSQLRKQKGKAPSREPINSASSGGDERCRLVTPANSSGGATNYGSTSNSSADLWEREIEYAAVEAHASAQAVIIPDAAEEIRDLDTTGTKAAAPPALRDLLTPQLVIILANYVFLCFTDMSCQVLQPLVYSTSIPFGGLGLDPYAIGSIMGVWGFCNAFVQINLLGRLVRRFGPRKMHVASYACFLVLISAYPTMGWLAKKNGAVGGWVWLVLGVQLTFQMAIYMAYGAIHIIIVNYVPSKSSLGTINGLVQMLGSGMRSVAPSIASSLFSVSLEKRLLSGNLVYVILFGVALVGVGLTLVLPEDRDPPADGEEGKEAGEETD